MKVIPLLLTMLISSVMIGCNKENNIVKSSLQTLSGNWELRTSTGNHMPDQSYEPGNGSVFVFAAGSYSWLNPGAEAKSGTYKLTRAPNPNTGEEISAVEFEGNSLGTVCYSLKDDVLTFYWSPLAACGSISTYARVDGAGSTSGNP